MHYNSTCMLMHYISPKKRILAYTHHYLNSTMTYGELCEKRMSPYILFIQNRMLLHILIIDITAFQKDIFTHVQRPFCA